VSNPPTSLYTLEKAPFGFKVTIAGRVTHADATWVLAESRLALKGCDKPFGVLVDIRTLKPLAEDVQKVVDETQRVFREQGLERSAVILASAIMTLQFMRIATETGVHAHERYIDASKDENWERTAISWIVAGVDPDRPAAPSF
jgi:hypothetical protein